MKQLSKAHQPPGEACDFLSGGNEMGRLMRAMDWKSTALSDPGTWSQSLRTSVSTCLNCSFPILIWWGPDLVKLYNDAYAPILGVKHPSALGAKGRDVWPEIWDVIGPMLERVMIDGEASPADDLLLMLERHGYAEECYFSFSYSPIRDESGGVGGVFCPVIETTSRVVGERRLRLQRRLAEQTADLRSLDEVFLRAASSFTEEDHRDLPFVVFYRAEEGGARLVSKTGLEAGNTAVSEMLPLEFTSGDPSPLAGAPLGVLVSASRIAMGDLPRGPWDHPPEHAVVFPLGAGASPAGYMVAGLNPCRPLDEMRDLTGRVAGQISTAISTARAAEAEKRRIAELAELDRVKTAFFANVSHEFRTPLTLLLGPLEDVIARPPAELSATMRGELELARRHALRLQKLVNTLLDFSRIEAGRTKARFVATDLAGLTTDLAAGFRSICEKAGLRLVVDCPPLPAPVLVDREMWEKIVLNLLSNAFKSTFEGEIVVTLRAAGDKARLKISDTGVGIAAADLPLLFDRFHRIEGQRSRTNEGSGIGLALVQELVRLQGGVIEAASQVGRGTDFIVEVPLEQMMPATRETGAGTARSLPSVTPVHVESHVQEALGWLGIARSDGAQLEYERPPQSSRARILVADDNSDMREYIARLLGGDWQVEVAADGEAALEAAQAHRPDLVLTDVMMPRLDGLGLLRALRRMPGLKDVPVVLLSARVGEEARIEGLDAGADDYISKPFSAHELRARVRAHLSLAHLRREVDQELKRVVSSISDGLLVLDRNWRYTFFNEQGARMIGMRPEDLLGRCVWDLFPAAIGTEFERAYRNVMLTRKPETFREYYPHPLNLWLECRCFPTDDGLSVYFHDVTAQVAAAATARAATERFKAAVDAVEGILWTNNAAGEMEGEQPGWGGLTGQTREEYQGFGWADAVHRDDAQPTIDAWTRAVAERRTFTFEHRVRRHDGEWRSFSIRAVPTFDADGMITEWVGVHIDITRQRQSEARQQLFLTLAERLGSSSEPRDVTATAAEVLGRHLGVSRTGYGEINPDGETVTYETCYADGVTPLVGTFPLAAFGRGNIAALRRGLTTDYTDVTVDQRTSDADFAAIDTRSAMAVPLIRDGQLSAALYVNHREVRAWQSAEVELVQEVAARTWDALGRARAEASLRELNQTLEARVRERTAELSRTQEALRQAQKMETLGQLAGGIAHDFNNVLQAVSGGLSLIEKRASDADAVRKIARMASEASQRGAAITGRLLSFARRGELQTRRVEAQPLLDGLCEMLAPTLGVGITIRLEVAPTPPSLLADKAQLETVLVNLAVNARDAMPEGGALTIGWTPETVIAGDRHPAGLGAGDFIRVDLSDTGGGMDEATLERASEPFFTTKPVGQGTGLGLAMARGFAAQSGGGFDIVSSPGQGTRVILWLPQAGVEADSDSGHPAPLQSPGSPVRALVVDDDSMVREILSQQLDGMGFIVSQALDGLEALDRIDRGECPELLITDYSMPGMNGLTLIEEARRRQPKLPVLLLTGFADAAVRLNLEDRQDDSIRLIRKPVMEEELARQATALLADASEASVSPQA